MIVASVYASSVWTCLIPNSPLVSLGQRIPKAREVEGGHESQVQDWKR